MIYIIPEDYLAGIFHNISLKKQGYASAAELSTTNGVQQRMGSGLFRRGSLFFILDSTHVNQIKQEGS